MFLKMSGGYYEWARGWPWQFQCTYMPEKSFNEPFDRYFSFKFLVYDVAVALVCTLLVASVSEYLIRRRS